MSAGKIIFHVTPHFSPQIDGIGDYASQLAVRLNSDHFISSRVIVADPQWRQESDSLETISACLVEHDASDLMRVLAESDTVVLHYSGYGYQHRGVPLWLVDGVGRWKREQSSRQLVVVFHELWASGPPWRSEFYLRPLQRRLVVKLHRLASVVLTSTHRMQRMLDAIEPGKTRFQAVPSCLPVTSSSETGRRRGLPIRAVLFGLLATRLRSAQTHAALLRRLHDIGSLAGVDVVGHDATEASTDVAWLNSILPGAQISVCGNVTAENAARRLAVGDVFLSAYPASLACKSSALTAALACGCVPVLKNAAGAEPLSVGREFLVCDGSARGVQEFVDHIRDGKLTAMSAAGREWQAANASWAMAAPRFAQLLHALWR